MNDTNAAGGAAVSIVILSRCMARIYLLHQLVTIQWQWYVLLADISLQDIRLCVSDSSEYCQHNIKILQQKLSWMQFKQFFNQWTMQYMYIYITFCKIHSNYL